MMVKVDFDAQQDFKWLQSEASPWLRELEAVVPHR